MCQPLDHGYADSIPKLKHGLSRRHSGGSQNPVQKGIFQDLHPVPRRTAPPSIKNSLLRRLANRRAQPTGPLIFADFLHGGAVTRIIPLSTNGPFWSNG